MNNLDAPFSDRIGQALACFARMRDVMPGTNASLFLHDDEASHNAIQLHGGSLWRQPLPKLMAREVLQIGDCERKSPSHGHYFVPLEHGETRLGVLVIDTELNASSHPARLEALAGIGESFVMARLNERYTQMLRRATNRAEASNVAKSQFLATMSHEIRTPMNGILGMAQLLLMPSLHDEERLDYARTIMNSGQTLLTLLNDILDISKIEAGKLSLNPAGFDPVQVLHETSALFAETARRKKLHLNVQWHGKPVRYTADSIRLRQMLSNLISNAIKFTTSGGIEIEAHELHDYGGQTLLEFSVRDTGIGIAEDKQVHLFKPFSQVDSSSTCKFGGTGLGLSIIRSLANLMGGAVGVESQEGHGARFWFRVRVEREAAESEVSPAGSSTKSLPPAADSTMLRLAGRVLVVEDNPTNCKVVRLILRKMGLEVDSVEDGQQALDWLKHRTTPEQRPSLILMDCQMPVMDGYTATEHIRKWEAGQAGHLPVIALTAGAYEDDRARAMTAGMDDFLTKPVNAEKLTEALRRWLPSQPRLEGDKSDASEGDAGANEKAGVAPRPAVEKARLEALLRDLDGLLAEHKFTAVSRYRELHTLFAGDPVEDELVELGRLIIEFQFTAAHTRLRSIARDQRWGDLS